MKIISILKLIVCPTVFTILIIPDTIFAEVGQTAPKINPVAGIAVWVLLIAWLLRKKQIGGWLLFYSIELIVSSLYAIPWVISSLAYYDPSLYEDKNFYILFVTTYGPVFLLKISEIILSASIFIKKFRNQNIIKLLRGVLILEIGFTMIKIFTYQIQPQLRPESIFPDIYSLIWPSIWLPYFFFSKRVNKVFFTKDWEKFFASNELKKLMK